jgi:hypothetical protein
MGRAYAFWALKPYDQFAKLSRLTDPDSIDCATLKTARDEIKKAQSDHIGKVMASLRQGAQPDVRADINVATGILVNLTLENHPDFFNALIMEGHAYFDLLPDHPGFGNKFNIRVQRVRAWIYSMYPEGKLNEVLITHTGPEKIVSSNRKIVQFTHDPVSVQFIYDSSKGVGNPEAIFKGGVQGWGPYRRRLRPDRAVHPMAYLASE